jgi:hypothetical protein
MTVPMLQLPHPLLHQHRSLLLLLHERLRMAACA